MKKSPVKQSVILHAAGLAAEPPPVQPAQPPRPIVGLAYPRHGIGTAVPRIVRVTEADTRYIRGYQLRHEYDEAPGEPKTFERRKIVGPVELLHLEPVVE